MQTRGRAPGFAGEDFHQASSDLHHTSKLPLGTKFSLSNSTAAILVLARAGRLNFAANAF